MTLLVAADGRRSLRDALPADATTAAPDAAGDATAREDPDVVVVDAASVPDVEAVVAAVRHASATAVVVAVGASDAGADVTAPTGDDAALRDAVERARRVADYRTSVADLYEACRDRALGRPDGDVRERRADADRRLDDLPDDSESVAAALRADREGEDG